MLWNLKIFLLSLESEQNSNQTMDFIVTPNATCKNNSMNTNSEEKDILRHIAKQCEDIQTRRMLEKSFSSLNKSKSNTKGYQNRSKYRLNHESEQIFSEEGEGL